MDFNNQMTDPIDKDQVFAKQLSEVEAFEFNEGVANVFRDMISRSVPGYGLLLHMTGLYARVFVQQRSNIYDLGCSLGDVSRMIAGQISAMDCSIFAVDNSPAMIEKCKAQHAGTRHIQWLCEDVQNIEIQNASLVILNLTLQFIKPDNRADLIGKIFRGLNPGGALILTEKVVLEDQLDNQRMVQLHQAFKKSQGYSDLEISQKRTALENVLVCDTDSVHRQRLEQAGFSEIYQCFHCFNFNSYLAIK
jgi:tRNA (cmo5U34)-methyltransferase